MLMKRDQISSNTFSSYIFNMTWSHETITAPPTLMKRAHSGAADVSEVFIQLWYKQRGFQMICGWVRYGSHPDEDPLPSL